MAVDNLLTLSKWRPPQPTGRSAENILVRKSLVTAGSKIEIAAGNDESKLEWSEEHEGKNLTESEEAMGIGRGLQKFARKRKLYAPK
ncbi:unnamed protein product [Orchesella dallaii]|uniref:Uncharacterized protein n=1 Tax=Orchesella dallaii TaxID=48710 RepID=A0ABP1PV00_9HEXA